MPFKKLFHTLVLACLAGGLAGCVAAGGEAPTPTPLPAVVNPEKVVFTVEQGPISARRDVYGEVVPQKQDNLFFHAPGYVNRVAVKGGDRVKKGDVLAELQIDDLLSQLQQARLDYATAQDNDSNDQLQQAYDLQKAESDVVVLLKQAEEAQRRLDTLSGSQKEDARAELEIAQERLKTAQAWLDMVKGKKNTGAQSEVERTKLTVQRLERLVSERQIVAPYDGLVLASFLTEGTDIKAFNTCFIFGDPTDLVVRIAYDAELSHLLEPSTEAYLSLTRSNEKQYPVKFLQDFLPVTSDKGGLEMSGDSVRLNYFYFSTPTELPLADLPLGGGVNLSIILGKKSDALLLPPAAIRGNDNFRYVIVLEDDYHRRVEVVNIGLKGDKVWEVEANLKAGDKVLRPINTGERG